MHSVRAAGSTITTLTLSSASVTSGTVVTFTASVSNGSPVTRGLVRFCDATATYCLDSAIIGTAQLTSSGAGISKRFPAIGTHSYKAMFVHTTTNTGSTSTPKTLTVTGLFATATTISSSGGAGHYTLTGTMTGKSSTAAVLHMGLIRCAVGHGKRNLSFEENNGRS
ncbi:MAG: Ig-like domain repeat protein [Candidatus Acidiferrum sp.]